MMLAKYFSEHTGNIWSRLQLPFALIIAALLINSCRTSTQITGSWKAEDVAHHFDKLVIAGIASTPDVRKAIGAKLEQLLQDKEVPATGGLHFLPPAADEENLTLEMLMEFLNLEKADGVLTITVLRMDDSKRYVPGSYYYSPPEEEYLTDYYGQMKNYIYLPGYSYHNISVFLEANLYTFPEGKLLWSAQTETIGARDLEEGAVEVAEALVNNLISNDVIASGSEK